MFVLFVMRSYLIEVRGLKPCFLKLSGLHKVVSYRGTWVETSKAGDVYDDISSYLIEVRGLKLRLRQIWLLINLSYLIEVRGLKLNNKSLDCPVQWSYLIEVRGLKPVTTNPT